MNVGYLIEMELRCFNERIERIQTAVDMFVNLKIFEEEQIQL